MNSLVPPVAKPRPTPPRTILVDNRRLLPLTKYTGLDGARTNPLTHRARTVRRQPTIIRDICTIAAQRIRASVEPPTPRVSMHRERITWIFIRQQPLRRPELPQTRRQLTNPVSTPHDGTPRNLYGVRTPTRRCGRPSPISPNGSRIAAKILASAILCCRASTAAGCAQSRPDGVSINVPSRCTAASNCSSVASVRTASTNSATSC
jgi:hypothetical protein